jgi:hypothetical protein
VYDDGSGTVTLPANHIDAMKFLPASCLCLHLINHCVHRNPSLATTLDPEYAKALPLTNWAKRIDCLDAAENSIGD